MIEIIGIDCFFNGSNRSRKRSSMKISTGIIISHSELEKVRDIMCKIYQRKYKEKVTIYIHYKQIGKN